MVEGGEARCRKGCCNSSNAFERRSGSFCRQASM